MGRHWPDRASMAVNTVCDFHFPGDRGIFPQFFILSPGALEYIDGDQTIWEREPLEGLSRDGELMAFRHEEFWQPMDTLREKHLLDRLSKSGDAPWKVWK